MPAHFTFTTADQIAPAPPHAALSGVTLQFADGTSQPAAPALVEALTSALAGFPNGATVHVSVDGDYVTPERASQLLGVSRPAIYSWQDRGELGRVQVANRRMVPLTDVLRKKDERRVTRAFMDDILAELAAHPDPQADLEAALQYFGSVPLGEDQAPLPE